MHSINKDFNLVELFATKSWSKIDQIFYTKMILIKAVAK